MILYTIAYDGKILYIIYQKKCSLDNSNTLISHSDFHKKLIAEIIKSVDKTLHLKFCKEWL